MFCYKKRADLVLRTTKSALTETSDWSARMATESIPTNNSARKRRAKRGEAIAWLNDVAIPYDGDECLIFPFHRAKSGHGRISGRKGTSLAHVYVAEKAHGPKPSPSHESCHDCGNGFLGCVTKRHLYWGTRAQNMDDRKRHGILVNPPVRLGASNTNVKLTEDDVRTIRLRLSSGETMLRVGKDYGVSTSTIMNIKTGKTWAWLV